MNEGKIVRWGAALALSLGLMAQAAPASQDTSRTVPAPRPYTNPAGPAVGTLPPDLGIAVGQAAPDAEVRDRSGAVVRLHGLFERGPVVLVFYRGGWCPYCNFQIRELTASYEAYRSRGITPVAISVDRVEEAARTQAAYDVPFPVLSDPDLAAHRAYRVLHQASDDEAGRLRGFGIDLEQASGHRHHTFAVPAIFVIDAQGVVRWAHADPEYKVRPSSSQVLAAIDSLGLRGAGK